MKPVVPLMLTLSALIPLPAMANVNYLIDLTRPEHGLARVEVSFLLTQSSTFLLNLPVWRTDKLKLSPVTLVMNIT